MEQICFSGAECVWTWAGVGAVATGLGALGTMLAVTVALWTVWRDHRRLRSEVEWRREILKLELHESIAHWHMRVVDLVHAARRSDDALLTNVMRHGQANSLEGSVGVPSAVHSRLREIRDLGPAAVPIRKAVRQAPRAQNALNAIFIYATERKTIDGTKWDVARSMVFVELDRLERHLAEVRKHISDVLDE